jgi:hypothetical protein
MRALECLVAVVDQGSLTKAAAADRAARADAVFVSGLRRRDEPSAGQVRQAIAKAIATFGRSGCAGRVAQEFGDHPETAVIRMRWAAGVAREAFADPGAERREPARSAVDGDG